MQAKTSRQPAHCASSFFATTKSLITHYHAHTTTTTTTTAATATTTTTDTRIIEQLNSEKTFTQHELNVIAVVVIVSDAAQNFDKHFSAEAYLKKHKISSSLKHRREY
jgi:hypothetical protein